MIDSLLDFLARCDPDDYRIGGGISPARIEAMEAALAVEFTEGYRRFLGEVGWLEINNVYFFGGRGDGDPAGEGSVVAMTRFARQTWGLPENLIVVYSSEDLSLWCLESGREGQISFFDTASGRVNGREKLGYWECLSGYLEGGEP